MLDLTVAWEELVVSAGLDPVACRPLLAELRAAYAAPDRAYHTLAHVAHVLERVTHLCAAGAPVSDPVAIRLAAWYHDAVYAAGAGDNEERSAGLAAARLAAVGLNGARVSRVAQLVRMTATHRPSGADEAALSDADLAILAAPPEAYRAYAAGIRREHGWLAEADWVAGRGAFLDGLLGRARLFTTAAARAWEPAARANLTAERSALARTSSPDG